MVSVIQLGALRDRSHGRVGRNISAAVGRELLREKVLEGVLPLVEWVDFPVGALVDLGGSKVEQLIGSEVVPDL